MSMMLPEGPMAPAFGPPPEQAPPDTGGYEEGATGRDRLMKCIEEIRAVANEHGLSDQERVLVGEAEMRIQKLLAMWEKEDQSLLGNTGGAMNALGRAYQGAS